MSDTAGWYPDPEGRTALERWWNGLGWSESVRPKPGAGTTLTAYAAGPSPYEDPYRDDSFSDEDVPGTSARRQRSRQPRNGRPVVTVISGARSTWIGWVAGIVAVGVLIAIVVVVGGSNDLPPTTTTAGQPSAPPSRAPGETRIVDEAAGVAYPYLGAYWLEFDTEVTETTSTAGQYIVTQQVVPNGGRFIAQVTSGPLQPFFQYSGPSSFGSTILDVQASVRLHYYPGPNTIETLRDEAIAVDGAAAYLLEFDLAWDVPGYDSTGERAALILIETGRSAPALMYISIPNTHNELYGIVDRVIDEIDVLP
ncbi:MAG: DUF2510 domain-containing protein [Actinomycetota bacterium]|nr:DUF2510 domain-containing protein [Actinomycetota bacterium]